MVNRWKYENIDLHISVWSSIKSEHIYIIKMDNMEDKKNMQAVVGASFNQLIRNNQDKIPQHIK